MTIRSVARSGRPVPGDPDLVTGVTGDAVRLIETHLLPWLSKRPGELSGPAAVLFGGSPLRAVEAVVLGQSSETYDEWIALVLERIKKRGAKSVASILPALELDERGQSTGRVRVIVVADVMGSAKPTAAWRSVTGARAPNKGRSFEKKRVVSGSFGFFANYN